MRRNQISVCTFGVIAALLFAIPALAGPPAGGGQMIAKYLDDLSGSGNDAFLVDANQSFSWDGGAGGDSTTLVAPGAGAGTPLVGDNGALCKSVGSQLFCDSNNSGTWDGNGGGDLSTNFSAGTGAGIFLFADLNGNGTKELIKYVANLAGSGNDAFLIDDNENNVWNGGAGGDTTYLVAPGAGPGTPFTCDCDANGTQEIGKFQSSGSFLFMDLDNDGTWDGNAGGDSSSTFAPGAGDGTFVFGGVGSVAGDVAVKYYADFNSTGNDLFSIDANGNAVWNGGAGGDANGLVAPGTAPGSPDVIDPDGQGAVLMKTTTASDVFVDLNGDGAWSGNAGGDSSSKFSASSGAGSFVVRDVPL